MAREYIAGGQYAVRFRTAGLTVAWLFRWFFAARQVLCLLLPATHMRDLRLACRLLLGHRLPSIVIVGSLARRESISVRVSETLGLRMALGADRAAVLRLVMREAPLLVAMGAAAGLPLAFLAGRALKGLLFGVAPLDPLIYASGTLNLVGISLTAAYLPARRAANIEPMTAVEEG